MKTKSFFKRRILDLVVALAVTGIYTPFIFMGIYVLPGVAREMVFGKPALPWSDAFVLAFLMLACLLGAIGIGGMWMYYLLYPRLSENKTKLNMVVIAMMYAGIVGTIVLAFTVFALLYVELDHPSLEEAAILSLYFIPLLVSIRAHYAVREISHKKQKNRS